MKLFTSVYFILFLCLAAAVIFFFLIRELIRILVINRMRREKGKAADHICDLLSERFSSEATVFHDVYLLKEEAADHGLALSCDVVYISRGGVLLLTVLPDVGAYDNPKIGPWRYRYVNKQKETVTLQIPNPFDGMAFFSAVTEKLLLSENVLNPSVSRAVVFSADPVGYSMNYPECLTIATLFDYIEMFNKRNHFNKQEYGRVCEAITACSEYLESGLKRKDHSTDKIRIPKAVKNPPEKS